MTKNCGKNGQVDEKALGLPPWGKVAPQGRMREKCAITVRKRIAAVNFALISQRSGPLTASPSGEAFSLFHKMLHNQPLRIP